MSKLNLLPACMIALGLAVGIVGCAGSPSKSGTSQSDAKGQQSDAKGQGGDAKAAKIAANLAKLSTADRAAAEKQKICPVTKAPLGSMGTPLPVDVGEGRIVWICCEGCREDAIALANESPDTPNSQPKDPHAGHDHSTNTPAAEDPKAAKIAAAMAKLSPENRAAAQSQGICPVAQGPLGAMGTPIPVDVGEGRIVFICCKGCRDTLLEDVDACLAVLAKHKQKPE